ncbi:MULTISPECIES: hypothetical protein [unclassified Streptomyces]|uniref:hypothetical protein n=1 Tax=unclassified Streptomyces TaxID=2593676 RepID=UPI0004BFB40B|nr:MULTISPECIES: hypothetical protein [unclassified Streptomyces]
MFGKLEALGSSLLERFVPKVDASAGAQWCQWMTFGACWQCKDICGYNAGCKAYCCDSAYNCGRVSCYC